MLISSYFEAKNRERRLQRNKWQQPLQNALPRTRHFIIKHAWHYNQCPRVHQKIISVNKQTRMFSTCFKNVFLFQHQVECAQHLQKETKRMKQAWLCRDMKASFLMSECIETRYPDSEEHLHALKTGCAKCSEAAGLKINVTSVHQTTGEAENQTKKSEGIWTCIY